MPPLIRQLAQMPRVLVASDFDGTLSPLVDQPDSARLHPKAQSALIKLAGLYPRVQLAFLSGRSLANFATKIPAALKRVVLAGNHGLEIRGAGLDYTHPAALALKPAFDALIAPLTKICQRIAGAELEDKGLSTTLHYRRVSARDLIALERHIAQLHLTDDIRRCAGKMVVEFRPQVEWNKGFALRQIIRHLGIQPAAGIYLGDDQTDEDAFRELQGIGTTLHVGEAQTTSRAWLNAHDPDDAAEFLRRLAGRLSAG